MKAERFEKGPVTSRIRDIEDDMGTPVRMDLLIEEDGDVILTLRNPSDNQHLEINFNTLQGGTHHPGVALKLKEIVDLLQNETNNQ